jgi:hypothetical protein
MDSRRITDWVQTLTGLAVVLGLVLVLWELQQSRDVALAQLTSDGFMQYSNISAAQIGEELPLAIEKACTNPESLLVRDLAALHAYYSALLDIPTRVLRIDARTGLYPDVWQDVARGELSLIFATSAGRAWWQTEHQNYPDEFRQVGDDALAQRSGTAGDCWLVRWQKNIPGASDQP